MRKRFTWRRVLAIVVVVALVLAAAGVAWLSIPQPVLPEADAALVSSPSVTVDQSSGRVTFTPAGGATTGFVLYPGAKVLPKAYAVPARAIAESGYLVVIPSMPLNLAVLDPNAALGVIQDHPEVDTWAVGGHSLGGAMSGQFVADHPDTVEGLVLWASYSATDVSQTGVTAAVIYGTLDAGAKRIASSESMALLPSDAVVTPIEGGNHANFGSYTGQPNDPPATIPREDQQADAAQATIALLDQISGD